MPIYRKIKDFGREIYLVSFYICTVQAFIKQSLFDFKTVGVILNLIMIAILGTSLTLMEIQDHFWEKKELLLSCLLTITFVLVAFKKKNPEFFVILLLILGARHFSSEFLMKKYLRLMFPISLALMMLAAAGITPNFVFYKDFPGEHVQIKLAMGYTYSLYVAKHIFFMMMCYICIKRRDLKYLEIGGFYLLTFIIHYFAHARTAFISSLIFLTMILGLKITRDYSLKKKGVFRLPSLANGIAMVIPLVIVAIHFVLGAVYNENVFWMEKLNQFFSGRLRLTHKAFKDMKFHLFGGEVTLKLIPDFGSKDYFYLDCSYVNVLYLMGFAMFVVLILSLIYQIYKSNINGFYEYAIAVIAVSIHAGMEIVLLEYGYHPFLILLFSKKLSQKKNSIRKRNTAMTVSGLSEGFDLRKIVNYVMLFTMCMFILVNNYIYKQNAKESVNIYYTSDFKLPNDGSDCTRRLESILFILSHRGRGILYFDEGIYGIQHLSIPTGISISGAGIEKTTLVQLAENNENENFIDITKCEIPFSIENMTIMSEEMEQESNAIEISYHSTNLSADAEEPNILLNNLQVKRFSGSAVIIHEDNYNVSMSNCICTENKGIGYFSAGNNCTVRDCTFIKNGRFGVLDSGDNNMYTNLYLKNNGYLSWSDAACMITGSDSTVKGIRLEANACGGIHLNGKNNHVEDVRMENNGYLNEYETGTTALLYISGEDHIVKGDAEQSSDRPPLNQYGIVAENILNCVIDFKISDQCYVTRYKEIK